MSQEFLNPNRVKAKKMMLLFSLLSLTMTFAGLTSAYLVSKGRPDWLVDFELPELFFYSTFILLLSSVSIQVSKYNLNKNIHFKHGKTYNLPGNVILMPSYHPSPRNVNTKLLSQKMMIDLFRKAKKLSTV